MKESYLDSLLIARSVEIGHNIPFNSDKYHIIYIKWKLQNRSTQILITVHRWQIIYIYIYIYKTIFTVNDTYELWYVGGDENEAWCGDGHHKFGCDGDCTKCNLTQPLRLA